MKYFKTLCFIMALVMMVLLFSACVGQEQPAETEAVENAMEALQDVDLDDAAETPAEESAVAESVAEPQVLALESFTCYWLGDAETMTVDQDFTLDQFGKIAGMEKLYSTVDCLYDEAGKLVRVEITDKDSGNMGYEDWTYTDGFMTARYYDENNGFRSVQDANVTMNTDDSGRVIDLSEEITYTDPEDGSQDWGTAKYEFEYDQNGYVTVVRYYSDGELDHTTNLTYDDNGNLLVYSNVGEDMGEYLRFEFTYASVDASVMMPAELDPFDYYLNWEKLLEYIL